MKLKELEHSKLIRKRYVLGHFDLTDMFYKGKYWISINECKGYTDRKSRDRNTYGFLTSAITFCPDCIRESIQENGFGYFKSIWWKSHWCRVHQKKLNVICSEGKKLSQDILTILSGKTVEAIEVASYEHFFNRDPEPFHLSIDSSFGELMVKVNYYFGIPICIKEFHLFNISPCLGKVFISWLIDNIKVFQNKYFNGDIKAWLNLFNKERSIKFRCSYNSLVNHIHVFFNLLCQESIQEFHDFIKLNAFYDEDQDLLFLKKVNCSKCPNSSWSTECRKSLDINRYRLTPPVVLRDEVERFELSSNRHTLNIVPKTCEEIKIKSIKGHIGKCFELDSNYICSKLEPKSYGRSVKDISIKGWVDLENINSNLKDNILWEVDYPISENISIYVYDELSSSNDFWPEIPFNVRVDWLTFMLLES